MLFAHIFCFYFAHYKGGMSRSNSRNSINQDLNSPRAENGGGGGRTGLSLASMGTGRHSAARAQTPSRRGSSVYIGGNGDDSGVFSFSFTLTFFCCLCFVGTFGYLFFVVFANFFSLLEDLMS